MDKPRVRFAPSPTGYLHIGGARTALFNWLWARKTGGTFILRIEDTDQARSTPESVEAIFDAMRWLGLDWDEGPKGPDDEGGGPHGPYFQMKRLALYKRHADTLIAHDSAYRCYCTREEQEAEKNALPKDKQLGYKHRCPYRDSRAELDKPFTVRFKAPSDGEVVFDDKVFGTIKTPNREQTDFVLLRSDGVPLYNFGAVVDDIAMGITLVARGRDHVVNTAPQILLYRALGAKVPEFAHLPLMTREVDDPEKPGRTRPEKLSKRHGAVSVTQYQQKGWVAQGLLSYLARFGWSYGDQELFTREDMVKKFAWDEDNPPPGQPKSRVQKKDGSYDWEKCGRINEKYVRDLATVDELATAVVPFLAARGLAVREGHPRLAKAIPTVRARATVPKPVTVDGLVQLQDGPLVSMADAMDFYFRAQPAMDAGAVAKFLVPDAAPLLDGLADTVEAIDPFGDDAVKTAIEAWLAKTTLELKAIAGPARVALTGRGVSPGLYEVIGVLGPQVSVQRLRAGAAIARGQTSP